MILRAKEVILLMILLASYSVFAQPGISYTPNILNFGNIPVKADSVLTLFITNVGNQDLVISELSIVGSNTSQFSMVDPPGLPWTITVDEPRDSLKIHFSPTSIGTKTASVRIVNNDPDNGLVTVSLLGTGTGSRIEALPPSLNFDGVSVGSDSTLTISIRNTGIADLIVDEIVIAQDNSLSFSLADEITLPVTIAVGAPSLPIRVKFSPVAFGDKTGALRITSNDPVTPFLSLRLDGRGTAPQLNVEPDSLLFGQVTVNTSRTMNLTVSNQGNVDLIIDDLEFVGNNPARFSLASPPPVLPLRITANGGSVSLKVQFTPLSGDISSAFLGISSNDPANTLTFVPLTGRGVFPDIVVSTNALNFETVVTGFDSILNIQISNTGDGDLIISDLKPLGAQASQFSVADPPGLPLTVPRGGAPATVKVRFAPTSTGIKKAFLVITSNDPDENPFQVSLEGIGIEPDIVVTPTSLEFDSVLVGRDSVRTFLIKNVGEANLFITDTSFAGSGMSHYSVFSIPTLPIRIRPNIDSVVVAIRFAPTSTGLKTASFRLTSNDPDENPFPVSLSGTGVVPDIATSVTNINFGEVLVGQIAVRTFQIRNLGGATLVISDTAIVGSDSLLFSISQIPPLPIRIPPGGDPVTVGVQFAPDSIGSKVASLRIFSNDPDENPLTMVFGGIGVQPKIAADPNPLDFGNVRVQTDSILPLLVLNEGGADLTVTDTLLFGTHEELFSVESMPELPFTIPAGGEAVELLIKFSPDALGEKTATLQFTSNDPNSPFFNVGLQGTGALPDIIALPTPLDFGDVIVDSDSIRNLFIGNTGGVPLTVDSLRIGGEDADLFSPANMATFPLVVPAMDTTRIPIQFTPDTLGPKSAFVEIFSDDPDEPRVLVPMTGTGVLPEIEVSPLALNFGNAPVNGNTILNLQIDNVGTASLLITDAQFQGESAASFSLAGDPQFPLRVEAGGTPLQLPVRFSPPTRGIKEAELQIFSNDADENPVSVALSGRGVMAPDIMLPAGIFDNVQIMVDLPVAVNVTADTSIQLVTMRYGPPAADFPFVDTLEAVADNAYSGNIPGQKITSEGLKIAFQATDNFPITSADTFFVQVNIPPGGLSYTFPNETLNRWQMFSLPFDTPVDADAAIGTILQDLGAEDGYSWRIYRMDSSGVDSSAFDSNALANAGEFGRFEPGNAFWLYLRDDGGGSVPTTTVNFPTMKTLSADSFPYDLQPGWNQIGSPYSFAMTWNQVESEQKDSLRVFSWNGTAWSEQISKMGWTPLAKANFTLEPWGGYAVYNSSSRPVNITFLPQKPDTESMPLARLVEELPWQVVLVAENETNFDVNIVGMNLRAAAGKDRLDYVNPEPLGEKFISQYFYHPEWNARYNKYCTDFRPLNYDGETWYFTINSSNRIVDFQVQESENLPPHFRILVFDTKYRRHYFLHEGEKVTFRDLNPGEENRFALLVGNERYINESLDNVVVLQPHNYQLLANYPNPFNPETFIRYQVSAAGKVSVSIYNVLGQEVKTLVNEFQEPGYYEIRWDGKNNSGLETASGVYIYRLQVNRFTDSRKMIKLK